LEDGVVEDAIGLPEEDAAALAEGERAELVAERGSMNSKRRQKSRTVPNRFGSPANQGGTIMSTLRRNGPPHIKKPMSFVCSRIAFSVALEGYDENISSQQRKQSVLSLLTLAWCGT
jgi:hypothetical protein